MGNMKFPRPKDINFPEIQNKMEFNYEKMAERRGREKMFGHSICPLKSGNILISYMWKDEITSELKVCLGIYSIPKLKLIQEYIFHNENDNEVYDVDNAIQLINGNIFTICDKLYIFDGESISKGPKTTSEEINYDACYRDILSYKDPLDILQKKTITKTYMRFLCDFMIEIVEGNTYEENMQIYLLDINNLKTKGQKIFEYKNDYIYHLDIIHLSEYYPENLYIIANSVGKSILFIFNKEEFCKKNKTPLSTIMVSESQNVFALCEYDKKYLLLDTIQKGIYIIDMESKQKVAVSELKEFVQGKYYSLDNKIQISRENRFNNLYRNMIKLKDGRVITLDYQFYLTDVREQIREPTAKGSAKFVYIDNYMICMGYNSWLIVYKFFGD